jgi:hypothetical protein|tara:strand:+ start:184 stop:1173 length:990 start_codon:yes stop_codon:yes gene_type:complete
MYMTDLATQKQEIFDYVNAFLGGGMVDVELDPIHYETALKKALTRYRQRSDNSVEESYIFLEAVVDQNEYTLPSEVVEVRKIFRRSIGSRPGTSASGGPIYSATLTATALQQLFNINYNLAAVATTVVTINGAATTNYSTDDDARTITFNTGLNEGDVVNVKLYDSGRNGGGSLFDPFSLAYTNAYLLSSSGMGGLATYDMFSQYQELVGRMFGAFIEFKWNTTSKRLTVLQRPRAEETLMLYCYNYRPDGQLLNDYMAVQWIKDYTLAGCKYMLGEAREKFATIAGPQGGTSLNGSSLKAEAQSEMEKLENEVAMAVAGGSGYGFVIG